MTTWLRYIGASIMGILDPVPSAVPSPMPEEEGAWVRAHAWTKGLQRIENAYPHGFHRLCFCEHGTCHPCATGHHDRCISRDGARVDTHVGTVTDRGGFVVAVIHYADRQRPCRWVCPCTHPAAPAGALARGPAQPVRRRGPDASRREPGMKAAGQDVLPFGELLPEMPVTSPWCQRWRGRRHSWRHVRDGGFDARRYTVEPLGEETAKAFVIRHHYSGSYPSATMRFGLYEKAAHGRPRLCGAAVFGVPVNVAVLTKPLPDLRPYTESLECSRFVLLDDLPGNSESWCLARCFDLLLSAGVRGLVSFADGVPRRNAAGALVMPGHVGTIYAASNAVYAGRATAPDGEGLAGRLRFPRPHGPEDPAPGAGQRVRHGSACRARSATAAAG
ncbi:hypothetical protein QFZ74_006117 [Streptomyces sp. V3I7]|nr:hypothetical protein [Streptomyces sp. V3I7]